jgi:hypothetical protein
MIHTLPTWAILVASVFIGLLVCVFIGGLLAAASKPCPKCDHNEENCECEKGKQK